MFIKNNGSLIKWLKKSNENKLRRVKIFRKFQLVFDMDQLKFNQVYRSNCKIIFCVLLHLMTIFLLRKLHLFFILKRQASKGKKKNMFVGQCRIVIKNEKMTFKDGIMIDESFSWICIWLVYNILNI